MTDYENMIANLEYKLLNKTTPKNEYIKYAILLLISFLLSLVVKSFTSMSWMKTFISTVVVTVVLVILLNKK